MLYKVLHDITQVKSYFPSMPKRLRLADLPASIRSRIPHDKPPSVAKVARSRIPGLPPSESPLVARLLLAIRADGLPEPVRELTFTPLRRWRFDLAWPERMLAVEVDGGVMSGGRHTRGAGFVADCEKLNTATLLGWRVLRFPGPHVTDGTAAKMLRQALADR